MSKRYMTIITSGPFLSFLYRFVRAYCLTFRLKIENEKEWIDYLKSGGTVLLCAWHQQFFSCSRHFQSYNIYKPSLMISKSKDGAIGAGFAERSGWIAVRGSSSKDGRQALDMMIENLKKFHLAGHIVDGPQGPAGIVKPGVIRIALAANAVIVPVYASADCAWYFNSWDKFMLPKPFARVTLRFGPMINLHADHADKDFEGQRKYLEEVMTPALVIPQKYR